MNFQDIFYPFIYAVITGCAGILVTFIAKFIKYGVDYVKAKIMNIKSEELRDYCIQMMQAAETMVTELVTGADKREWVADKIATFAMDKNIPLTESQIYDLIQGIFQELDGITLNKYKAFGEYPDNVEYLVSTIVDDVLDKMNNGQNTEN